jgi:tetratricopeptide (TPR) repeat protein
MILLLVLIIADQQFHEIIAHSRSQFTTEKAMRKFYFLVASFVVLVICLLGTTAGLADVAPPDVPPGANPLPGSETTQVQMLSETVLLDVISNPASGAAGQARTTATFTMRNLGNQTETLAVRFPLTFWNGASDGFSHYPEIGDLKAYINDKSASTRRVVEPSAYDTWEGRPIPWAAFDVVFPPGENVVLKIVYTANAQGDFPQSNIKLIAFRYILETGSGWAGTIGQADVIVRLPYPASIQNVMLSGQTGYSSTTPGAEISGSEVRWSFRNFEPSAEDNLEVTIVQPAHWLRILQERQNVQANPQDGEAWGRLGKACKEALYFRRDLRDDPGGEQLYQEAKDAYRRSLELLPDDALWHLGSADLLWTHFLYRQYWSGSPPYDYTELEMALHSLKRSLELQPNLERALEILDWIAGTVPEALARQENGYDYLLLTATPLPPTLAPSDTPPPTPTLLPTQTSSATVQPLPTSTPPPPTPEPTATFAAPGEAGLPTQAPVDASGGSPARREPCSAGAFPLLLPVAGILLALRRRRIS